MNFYFKYGIVIALIKIDIVLALYKVGKCPKLESNWDSINEGIALNHTKLLGYW